MNNEQRIKIANRISVVTIIANIILSVIKVIVGFIGKSNAVIADGFHSLSDVFSTIVALIGIRLANKEDDENHPYGHEKIEPVMGKILANILLITALFMGYNGIKNIIQGNYTIPEKITIYAAVFSIIVKEWMYRYTVKGAKKIDSSALLADAWHHRSDALSSVGSLLGVTGAILGYPILDSIAAVIISVFVAKVAIDIYLQSIKELIDSAADEETIDDIRKIILETEGVIQIDELKTRIHANKLYADVEISVSKDLSVSQAHDIAENVHYKIEKQIKKVKHCMVHVNPFGER
ncbi:cation diffusion facilitator family transporter [Paramaledivibacter caminithermalis]|jgi:cation diffusion facilitator family transporter|nr:cation diffusion facilitator family transporter [Paramaledivibacter caminithermalis]